MSVRLLQGLLQWAWASPVMPDWMASLPESGGEGTLARSGGPPRRARLKTGSLNEVAALSGYVMNEGGQRLAFTAVVNTPDASAPRARPVLWALVRWAMQATAPQAPQDAAARAGPQGR